MHTGWLAVCSVVLICLLVVSGLNPYDRATWAMEVVPVVLVVPFLWFTRESYSLTPLLYALVFLHALVLILGGAYTYARVPLGFEIQELFDLQRNPYDKIGHFMQGFVPALAAREVLIRGSFVHGRKMLTFVVICIAMAISAIYELVEWGAALVLGQGADEFLGTQGDRWDTQSDMFFALVGACTLLLFLASTHDRQLCAVKKRAAA